MIDITTTIRPAPFLKGVGRLPFEAIGRRILGTRYELSLVICGDALSRRVNKTYRHKTYAPNVLAFTLEKNEGEIFLNVRKAAREAKTFGIPFHVRLALLFIHGCLHLKGMRHGRTMEATEKRTLRAFRIT